MVQREKKLQKLNYFAVLLGRNVFCSFVYILVFFSNDIVNKQA